MEDEIHRATAAHVAALEHGNAAPASGQVERRAAIQQNRRAGCRLVRHAPTGEGPWQRAVEVFDPDGPAQARRTLGEGKR